MAQIQTARAGHSVTFSVEETKCKFYSEEYKRTPAHCNISVSCDTAIQTPLTYEKLRNNPTSSDVSEDYLILYPKFGIVTCWLTPVQFNG